MSRQQTSVISAASLLVLCGLLLLVFSSELWLAPAVAQAPVIPAARGEQCVADTDLMRKNHMDMLNHQRDETVIDGVRGKPFSLVGCVDCHAQTTAAGEPVRIDAPGQFCESCHQYAAVSIDCFSCHAAIPAQQSDIGFNRHSVPGTDSRHAVAAMANPAFGADVDVAVNAVIHSGLSPQSQPLTAAFHSTLSGVPIESADLHATGQ